MDTHAQATPYTNTTTNPNNIWMIYCPSINGHFWFDDDFAKSVHQRPNQIKFAQLSLYVHISFFGRPLSFSASVLCGNVIRFGRKYNQCDLIENVVSFTAVRPSIPTWLNYLFFWFSDNWKIDVRQHAGLVVVERKHTNNCTICIWHIHVREFVQRRFSNGK